MLLFITSDVNQPGSPTLADSAPSAYSAYSGGVLLFITSDVNQPGSPIPADSAPCSLRLLLLCCFHLRLFPKILPTNTPAVG